MPTCLEARCRTSSSRSGLPQRACCKRSHTRLVLGVLELHLSGLSRAVRPGKGGGPPGRARLDCLQAEHVGAKGVSRGHEDHACELVNGACGACGAQGGEQQVAGRPTRTAQPQCTLTTASAQLHTVVSKLSNGSHNGGFDASSLHLQQGSRCPALAAGAAPVPMPDHLSRVQALPLLHLGAAAGS